MCKGGKKTFRFRSRSRSRFSDSVQSHGELAPNTREGKNPDIRASIGETRLAPNSTPSSSTLNSPRALPARHTYMNW